MPLDQAGRSMPGAVRFRPMALTAAAVIVGPRDPVRSDLSGLAISLMAGEVASLLLSRMAVPVLYYMARRREPVSNLVSSSQEG
jgi:multidrug efflux pump subunit AcrB